jgi:hypothetical protein
MGLPPESNPLQLDFGFRPRRGRTGAEVEIG